MLLFRIEYSEYSNTVEYVYLDGEMYNKYLQYKPMLKVTLLQKNTKNIDLINHQSIHIWEHVDAEIRRRELQS